MFTARCGPVLRTCSTSFILSSLQFKAKTWLASALCSAIVTRTIRAAGKPGRTAQERIPVWLNFP